MDAAQTKIKKIAFFLATALLLTAPFHASAQATLIANASAVTIGNSSCNDYQNVQIASSDGSNQQFKVAVQYQGSTPNTGDVNGAWVYATVLGAGTTSTGTQITASTTTTGTTLTIGLNRTFSAVSDTATVVVTPVDGTAAISITVNYSQNTSCGGNTGFSSNGFITITPGNIAISAALGSQSSQAVSIQNDTGSALGFTYTATPSNQWLSVSGTSNALAPNGTTSLNVLASTAGISSTGTYTGYLTVTSLTSSGAALGAALNIPVTLVVTNGSTTGGNSGTLTLNGNTSNTFTTSISYVEPNLPGGQCVGIQDSAPNVDSYSYVVTTNSGGNWLFANYSTGNTITGLLAPSSNACVVLSLNPGVATSTMPSGVYTGSVALTSASGSTATITVNLYVSGGVAPGITVNPTGAIYTFPNVASNTAVVQQQQFTLVAATGYSLGNATPSSPPSWFSMSTPTTSGNTESFNVTVNSNGLSNGVYGAVITVPSSGTQSGTTTITVVLPVGQAGTTTTTGGVTTVIGPQSLSFQQQTGNSYWTGSGEVQNVTITGQQGTTWTASFVYGSGANWLNFDFPAGSGSGASGTFAGGPATLGVDLFNGVTGLAASSNPYTATVIITTQSGTYSVPVSVLVTPSNTPVLLGKPASATFSSNGGSTPAAQAVSVVGSDNTGSTSTPPITVGAPTVAWITATASGNTMTISVNPAGLNTGVYSGTIPVSATAYANPINYPVVLIVNGGGTTGTGPLTVSPTSLSFTNVTGQISQSLNITASTASNFSVTSQETSCNSTPNWLQVATGSYTASLINTAIQVTVNPNGVASGATCAGIISLVTSTTSQTVNVSMTVAAATGSGNVTVSQTTMSFQYLQGQSAPAAQTVTIVNTNTGTASIPFTVTTTENNGTSANWLLVNGSTTTSAATPYNNPGLSVSVAPGSLTPNTYTGTVTITPTGGTAVIIGVTMTVSSSAVVTASPLSISMTYQVGGTSPTSTIQVSGGGSAVGFTATASSSGWLQVSPTSGTTTNTGTIPLTVSVAASALGTLTPANSPYTGTITVAATSPATGSTTVNVSLAVTAPLPVISSVTNAASFATGGVSPGEIVSIFANAANPIGPATPVLLNLTTCPSPCSVVPNTLGGVQVIFLPSGIAAPLTYVSATQINAVVPYQATSGSLSVEVKFLGQASNAYPLTAAPTAPGIFTAGTGTGAIAAAQYSPTGTYSVNTVSTQALPGYTLVMYLTGEGLVTPLPANGAVTTVSSTLPLTPQPQVAPTVLIDNQPATVTFYGEAPGLVSGVLQINVVVPNIPAADAGAVKVSVSFGASSSQAGTTVFVQ